MTTLVLSTAASKTASTSTTSIAAAETSAIPTDIASESFKTAYTRAMSQIQTAHNVASTYGQRPGAKRAFTIDNLNPTKVSTCVFWNRLDKETAANIKGLYDRSVTNTAGHKDTLYHLTVEYQTCSYVSTNDTYYITDLCDASPKPVEEQTNWNKVLVFVQSLIYSKLLNGVKIHKSKRAKTQTYGGSSDYYQSHLMRAMYEDNQSVLGNLAACFMWMVMTPGMNKAYENDTSRYATTLSGTFRCNKSPLLTRRLAPVVVAKPKTPQQEPVEEPVEQDKNDIPDNWEDSIDDDDIPDNWEDSC